MGLAKRVMRKQKHHLAAKAANIEEITQVIEQNAIGPHKTRFSDELGRIRRQPAGSPELKKQVDTFVKLAQAWERKNNQILHKTLSQAQAGYERDMAYHTESKALRARLVEELVDRSTPDDDTATAPKPEARPAYFDGLRWSPFQMDLPPSGGTA